MDEEREPLLPPEGDIEPTVKRGRTYGFSTLTRLMLLACLLLVLLASTFIGLFAGAQHRLKHQPTPSPSTVFTTIFVPTTVVATPTSAPTTTYTPSPTPTPTPPTCQTPECVVLAGRILEKLNTSASSCNEFPSFAYGRWVGSHSLPYGTKSISIDDEWDRAKKSLIRDLLTAPSDGTPLQNQLSLKLQTFHTACTKRQGASDEILKSVIRRIGSLAGVTIDGAKHIPDLTRVLAYLHSLGIDAIFNINIDTDPNTERKTLWFQSPSIVQKALVQEPYNLVYKTAIERVLYYFDEDDTDNDSQSSSNGQAPWPSWPPSRKPPPRENRTARAHRLSEAVFAFEQKLFDAVGPSRKSLPEYHSWPIKKFMAHLKYIDLPGYMSSFAPRAFPANVILPSVSSVKNLNSLIVSTSLETLSAYFKFRAVLDLGWHAPVGSEPFEIVKTLKYQLDGGRMDEYLDREKFCLDHVEQSLGLILGNVFANKTLDAKSIKSVQTVVSGVIDAASKGFRHSVWMDSHTAGRAVAKAKTIHVHIGALPDDLLIRRFNALVQLHPDSHLANVLAARVGMQQLKWTALTQTLRSESPTHLALSLKPSYNDLTNELFIPAALIHNTVTTGGRSFELYGSLGFLTAKELVHAFDRIGSSFNETGLLRNWWSNSTAHAFRKQEKCLIDQYSAYSPVGTHFPEIVVNGTTSLDENLSDAAITLAYSAWKESEKRSTTHYRLPGVSYTDEQLFFIAVAQHLREVLSDDLYVESMTSDQLPNAIRLQGMMDNSPAFSDAFECSRPKVKYNLFFFSRGEVLNSTQILKENMQCVVNDSV